MRTKTLLSSVKAFLLLFQLSAISCQSLNENYECVENRFCRRLFGKDIPPGDSMSECRLKCGVGNTLWPMPTGVISVSQEQVEIDINSLKPPRMRPSNTTSKQSLELDSAMKTIHELVFGRLTRGNRTASRSPEARQIRIKTNFNDQNIAFDYDTSEAYTIMFHANEMTPLIIYATHFMGYRNAMITVGQLIGYNERTGKFVIPSDILIRDSPKYPHRGVMIDTGNNYLSVPKFIRILEGLALSKINTVHWHVTDKTGFPLIIPRQPYIKLYGLMNDLEFYSAFDLYTIALRARRLGIRIIPEVASIDRVGMGFQWGPKFDLDNLITCFDSENCRERPCSQLNVENDNAWNVWSEVQSVVTKVFSDWIYHLGGDDVMAECMPTTSMDWKRQWAAALNKARTRLIETSPHKNLKTIVFSGPWVTETNYAINPNDFIVQIKDKEGSESYRYALDNGYNIIVSAKDRLDWRCGMGSWYNESYGATLSGCGLQQGWHRAYDLELPTGGRGRVLGAEGFLYSGLSDHSGTEELVLTRAAGLAERLWTDPDRTLNHLDAFERIAYHVYARLNFLGFRAETVMPEWCMQHMGKCLIGQ